MSRHNSTTTRERRPEGPRQDAASSPDRSARNDKEPRSHAPRQRVDAAPVSGMSRYTLNDLYERSSI